MAKNKKRCKVLCKDKDGVALKIITLLPNTSEDPVRYAKYHTRNSCLKDLITDYILVDADNPE